MGIKSWKQRVDDIELRAPFYVDQDNDYYPDLRKRLTRFVSHLEEINADKESIRIARKYSDKICEAVRDYYSGRISTCHRRIYNIVKGCLNSEFAVSTLDKSRAFPGAGEIQFFRARKEDDARTFEPKEMLHRPFTERACFGNYRFSIPGITCLFLSNSSYGCWIEVGRPSEHDFNVSPVLLDGTQKIFNLTVMARDILRTDAGNDDIIHCWIKLLVLMIATSYRIKEGNRTLRSEYIVSQGIMLACKKCGIDGVAYYSKRVEDEIFAFSAINLALFSERNGKSEYGIICNRLKIDESMNYQFFKQLGSKYRNKSYQLRIESHQYIDNIGKYRYQYSIRDTDFIIFDKFLFGRWADKDNQPWGNALITK